jgi:hypothetical protein
MTIKIAQLSYTSELLQNVCKVDGLYEKGFTQTGIFCVLIWLNIQISEQLLVKTSHPEF